MPVILTRSGVQIQFLSYDYPIEVWLQFVYVFNSYSVLSSSDLLTSVLNTE